MAAGLADSAAEEEVYRMRQRLIQLVSSSRIGDLCRRIVRLSAYGTQGYPARIRRRLKIMNVTAYVIVVLRSFTPFSRCSWTSRPGSR